jgi:hypothetical protein
MWKQRTAHTVLTANIRRVVDILFLLLGDSPEFEICVSTLMSTLYHLHSSLFTRLIKMEQSAPKRRHIKFRRRRNTQKEEHNMREVLHFLGCP